MASLHQMDASYDMNQDRILLRLTNDDGEEIRLWMTRRMTQLFLTDFKDNTSTYRIPNYTDDQPSLTENATNKPKVAPVRDTALNTGHTKAIADFEQQVAASKSNFSEAFKPGEHFPVGEDGIIINKIKIKANQEANADHTVMFFSLEGHCVSLNVNVQIFNTLFELIERVNQATNWMINQNIQPEANTTLQ